MGAIGDFFAKLFGGKSKDLQKSLNLKILNAFTPQFSNEFRAEFNSTFVSAVNAHARHIEKILPMCMLGDNKAENREYLNRILQLKPNRAMSAPALWKAVAKSYFQANLAILWLEWDYTNIKEPLKGIWLLDFDKNSISSSVTEQGEVTIKFGINGQTYYADLSNLIILTREVDASSFFGKRSPAIDQVLKVIQTNYEGVEQAIRMSSFIRFIIETAQPMNDKTKKEKSEEFAKQYLDPLNAGVVFTDKSAQITQINGKGQWAPADDVKTFVAEIFSYLGISEEIIQAKYNEDQWQSYYESSIEPFCVELAAELTSKIFTKSEIEHGNRIVIDSDPLQTASLKTRVQVANAYLKLPKLIPNTVNKLLNLPLTPNGDKEVANLNFVNANKQDAYQGVGSNDDPKEDEPNADNPK